MSNLENLTNLENQIKDVKDLKINKNGQTYHPNILYNNGKISWTRPITVYIDFSKDSSLSNFTINQDMLKRMATCFRVEKGNIKYANTVDVESINARVRLFEYESTNRIKCQAYVGDKIVFDDVRFSELQYSNFQIKLGNTVIGTSNNFASKNYFTYDLNYTTSYSPDENGGSITFTCKFIPNRNFHVVYKYESGVIAQEDSFSIDSPSTWVNRFGTSQTGTQQTEDRVIAFAFYAGSSLKRMDYITIRQSYTLKTISNFDVTSLTPEAGRTYTVYLKNTKTNSTFSFVSLKQGNVTTTNISALTNLCAPNDNISEIGYLSDRARADGYFMSNRYLLPGARIFESTAAATDFINDENKSSVLFYTPSSNVALVEYRYPSSKDSYGVVKYNQYFEIATKSNNSILITKDDSDFTYTPSTTTGTVSVDFFNRYGNVSNDRKETTVTLTQSIAFKGWIGSNTILQKNNTCPVETSYICFTAAVDIQYKLPSSISMSNPSYNFYSVYNSKTSFAAHFPNLSFNRVSETKFTAKSSLYATWTGIASDSDDIYKTITITIPSYNKSYFTCFNHSTQLAYGSYNVVTKEIKLSTLVKRDLTSISKKELLINTGFIDFINSVDEGINESVSIPVKKLINNVAPGLDLNVSSITGTHTGKHTVNYKNVNSIEQTTYSFKNGSTTAFSANVSPSGDVSLSGTNDVTFTLASVPSVSNFNISHVTSSFTIPVTTRDTSPASTKVKAKYYFEFYSGSTESSSLPTISSPIRYILVKNNLSNNSCFNLVYLQPTLKASSVNSGYNRLLNEKFDAERLPISRNFACSTTKNSFFFQNKKCEVKSDVRVVEKDIHGGEITVSYNDTNNESGYGNTTVCTLYDGLSLSMSNVQWGISQSLEEEFTNTSNSFALSNSVANGTYYAIPYVAGDVFSMATPPAVKVLPSYLSTTGYVFGTYSTYSIICSANASGTVTKTLPSGDYNTLIQNGLSVYDSSSFRYLYRAIGTVERHKIYTTLALANNSNCTSSKLPLTANIIEVKTYTTSEALLYVKVTTSDYNDTTYYILATEPYSFESKSLNSDNIYSTSGNTITVSPVLTNDIFVHIYNYGPEDYVTGFTIKYGTTTLSKNHGTAQFEGYEFRIPRSVANITVTATYSNSSPFNLYDLYNFTSGKSINLSTFSSNRELYLNITPYIKWSELTYANGSGATGKGFFFKDNTSNSETVTFAVYNDTGSNITQAFIGAWSNSNVNVRKVLVNNYYNTDYPSKTSLNSFDTSLVNFVSAGSFSLSAGTSMILRVVDNIDRKNISCKVMIGEYRTVKVTAPAKSESESTLYYNAAKLKVTNIDDLTSVKSYTFASAGSSYTFSIPTGAPLEISAKPSNSSSYSNYVSFSIPRNRGNNNILNINVGWDVVNHIDTYGTLLKTDYRSFGSTYVMPNILTNPTTVYSMGTESKSCSVVKGSTSIQTFNASFTKVYEITSSAKAYYINSSNQKTYIATNQNLPNDITNIIIESGNYIYSGTVNLPQPNSYISESEIFDGYEINSVYFNKGNGISVNLIYSTPISSFTFNLKTITGVKLILTAGSGYSISAVRTNETTQNIHYATSPSSFTVNNNRTGYIYVLSGAKYSFSYNQTSRLILYQDFSNQSNGALVIRSNIPSSAVSVTSESEYYIDRKTQSSGDAYNIINGNLHPLISYKTYSGEYYAAPTVFLNYLSYTNGSSTVYYKRGRYYDDGEVEASIPTTLTSSGLSATDIAKILTSSRSGNSYLKRFGSANITTLDDSFQYKYMYKPADADISTPPSSESASCTTKIYALKGFTVTVKNSSSDSGSTIYGDYSCGNTEFKPIYSYNLVVGDANIDDADPSGTVTTTASYNNGVITTPTKDLVIEIAEQKRTVTLDATRTGISYVRAIKYRYNKSNNSYYQFSTNTTYSGNSLSFDLHPNEYAVLQAVASTGYEFSSGNMLTVYGAAFENGTTTSVTFPTTSPELQSFTIKWTKKDGTFLTKTYTSGIAFTAPTRTELLGSSITSEKVTNGSRFIYKRYTFDSSGDYQFVANKTNTASIVAYRYKTVYYNGITLNGSNISFGSSNTLNVAKGTTLTATLNTSSSNLYNNRYEFTWPAAVSVGSEYKFNQWGINGYVYNSSGSRVYGGSSGTKYYVNNDSTYLEAYRVWKPYTTFSNKGTYIDLSSDYANYALQCSFYDNKVKYRTLGVSTEYSVSFTRVQEAYSPTEDKCNSVWIKIPAYTSWMMYSSDSGESDDSDSCIESCSFTVFDNNGNRMYSTGTYDSDSKSYSADNDGSSNRIYDTNCLYLSSSASIRWVLVRSDYDECDYFYIHKLHNVTLDIEEYSTDVGFNYSSYSPGYATSFGLSSTEYRSMLRSWSVPGNYRVVQTTRFIFDIYSDSSVLLPAGVSITADNYVTNYNSINCDYNLTQNLHSNVTIRLWNEEEEPLS